jgi:hypothetical protein
MRKAIAGLRRELNDLEMLIASIEERMAASLDNRSNPAPPKRTRDLIASLRPPFQEPEFGLWLQEDN